jgi:hypothetical protein
MHATVNDIQREYARHERQAVDEIIYTYSS